jgi:hypothetical protein
LPSVGVEQIEQGEGKVVRVRTCAAIRQASSTERASPVLQAARSRKVLSRRSPMTRLVVSITALKTPSTVPPSPRIGLKV